MLKLVVLVIVCAAFHQARGEALSDEEHKAAHDALYNMNEMQLNKEQKQGLRNRVAIAELARRWPGGNIPYVIDPSRADLTNMIYQAAEHIRVKTNNCIKFFPNNGQRNYVRIVRGGGCSSPLGMWGGPQDLSLGAGCEYIGTVVHEMLHAVGIDHQQNRPDRDNSINVYKDNVIQGMGYNFDKTPGGQTFGTQFDYDSVMLYGEYSFSRSPGTLKTMEDRNKRKKLTDPFTKNGMTDTDAYEVKRFYGCA